MNYDLALQLKEAGFPFRGPFYEEEVSDNPYYKEFYPALSELIEACGAFFGALTNKQTHWIAVSADLKHIVEGSTPEESVAKLWLSLNKKQ